jgi:G:T/U-mismatch repair DNA glycosylase
VASILYHRHRHRHHHHQAPMNRAWNCNGHRINDAEVAFSSSFKWDLTKKTNDTKELQRPLIAV